LYPITLVTKSHYNKHITYVITEFIININSEHFKPIVPKGSDHWHDLSVWGNEKGER